ncbi:hypothetical protein QL285_050379 [Trifolium repens]|nr:hypothetical protein QL285_050379 [Trifolium repens]
MAMDKSIPVLESPAIRRVRDKVEENIDELIDNVGEFQLYVEELNDYKWRLTNDQKIFLDLALELSRRLEKDVAFIETTNAVFKCYHELEDTLEQKISVTKDSIDLQEESLYLNLSAEEAVENRIEVLEKELRPLMKRKMNLQLDIEYDVARLIRTRSSLARLKEKMERLQDDQDRISLTSQLPRNIRRKLRNCRPMLSRPPMSLLK